MKIFVVCMRHGYGDPSREYSYEYFNFYKSLAQMGHDVELFDYMAEIKECGKSAMNQRLLARVQETRPQLTMFSLYTDQFEPEVVQRLSEYTKTLCFFHDDTWRVEFSRYWARFFDFFTTPDLHGELKYAEIGLDKAIYFPFGVNEQIFQKQDIPKKYDVSFVGAWHPYRQWLIERLRKAGISVTVFGYNWPAGEVKQDEMARIFNESRINLNLSNSAPWDCRYLLSSPRAMINRVRSKKNVEQLKARFFEVGGCGAFLLSYFVEGLADCYAIDRELAVFTDVDDLLAKVRFYLAHDGLRETMARACYERTLQDHTFSRRFEHVFARMGLS